MNKYKLFFIGILSLCFAVNLSAQESKKFLLGIEYAGIGMKLKKSYEKRSGPFEMYGLNLQYYLGKRYSLIAGISKRRVGAFSVREQFENEDVSAFTSKYVLIADKVKVNPNFNVFSLGVAFTTFDCDCVHHVINYDMMSVKGVEVPEEDFGKPPKSEKLYRNFLTGFRYTAQLKVAFPENNFRIYFGPTISLIKAADIAEFANPNFRMGVTLGTQYLFN